MRKRRASMKRARPTPRTNSNGLTKSRLQKVAVVSAPPNERGDRGSFRKEVIQPQVLLQLPCYDFTPIMNHTVVTCPLTVSAATSSTAHFRDVTGGVYKTRERIHRSVLICDY